MSSPFPLPVEIHRSAERGELQKVVKWVRKGGPVDALCSTSDAAGRPSNAALLHAAAANGQLEVVRQLLKRGASVDLPTSLGSTALMDAAVNGQPSVVLVLLQHSANPDLQDEDGRTALIRAGREYKTLGTLKNAERRAQERGTLQEALEALPDVLNTIAGVLQDSATAQQLQLGVGCGHTRADTAAGIAIALGKVAQENQEECVQALLRAKANTELLDNDGNTALQCAEITGQAAIAELIRKHAATPQLAAISHAAPPDEPVESSQSAPASPVEIHKSAKRGKLQAAQAAQAEHVQQAAWAAAAAARQAADAADAADAAQAEQAEQAAQADAAMEELLAEEAAEQIKGQAHSKKSKKKKKKKKKAGRAAAAGDESSEAPPPAVPAPSPAAAPKPAASATERAEAGLRAAIASGRLSTLELALAAAPHEVRQDGVVAEARAQRDRLLEAQQKAEREAKREAAAEAAKLAAAERAQEAAAREAKLAAAAASKAREAAEKKKKAAAAAAAAAAAKAEALERATADGGESTSSWAAGPSEAGEAVEVPDDYVCPITAEIMTDPVCTVDGFTYEHKAISDWLQTKDTSPITGIKLESKMLIPNIMARSLLRRLSSSNDAAKAPSTASLQPPKPFVLPLPSLPPCATPLPSDATRTELRLQPVAGLQQLQAEALAMYGSAIELCDAEELSDAMRNFAPVLDRLRSERSPDGTLPALALTRATQAEVPLTPLGSPRVAVPTPDARPPVQPATYAMPPLPPGPPPLPPGPPPLPPGPPGPPPQPSQLVQPPLPPSAPPQTPAPMTSDAAADDAHPAVHAPDAGPSGSTLSPHAEVFRPATPPQHTGAIVARAPAVRRTPMVARGGVLGHMPWSRGKPK